MHTEAQLLIHKHHKEELIMGPFCVVFACSPHVGVGFFRVPMVQKHALLVN